MFDATHEPRPLILRDYQLAAIEGLRQHMREGRRRVILCAGTGAGKSILATHLLREADAKGSYALFVVDRVALIDQVSATLDDYGVPHGVLQGIHPRYEPHRNIQVASIQTLARRSLPRSPALFVHDEAHCQYRSLTELMDAHPSAARVGLTATPFTKGMAQHWDGMFNVLPTSELVRQGHLIEPIIYEGRAPAQSDYAVNGRGEFDDRSAEAAGTLIVGDVVAEWEAKTSKHFGGPVKTIVFAATVEHGRELCEAFAAAGHRFEQISYMDRDDEARRAKIAEFRADGGLDVPPGGIVGLVSCGVLTRGFDVPSVRCGISCRPYRRSLSAHMQEIGRVMRTMKGKAAALWLDHSGNVGRLQADTYAVWDHGPGGLSEATKKDSTPREASDAERKEATCPECSARLHGPDCTGCGWHRPARSGIVAMPGEMHEVNRKSTAFAPRAGLSAKVLADPRAVWEAALAYCFERSRKGPEHARRWAYGAWRGIYPDSKMPWGWYDLSPPAGCREDAYALIEREQRRFRKRRGA